tara:strand:+ start:451 stop:3306 length:2856 start_codon:yes stop_codon:yes gene_type:complete
MLKKALMKMSVIGIVGAAFVACGIVDVEQAQGVVDLRARILEIQTSQVDPLIDQINAIEEQVAPIEAEIEALERQKGKLYEQAKEMGQKFDQEMRERFDTAYMEGDQARGEFEKEIEARYRELEEKERQLQDERRRLVEEQGEAFQQKKEAIEDAGQDTWEALEFEMREKEEGAQKVSKFMWRAWGDEREEAHQQVEDLRREFEENNPFNMEMEAIHQAWKDIDDLYFEIDVEQMQIEEARMELNDMIRPLEEQAQQLRRTKRDIQEQDPATFARIAGISGSEQNIDERIKEREDKLEDLRKQLREAIDEQQQIQTEPKQLDWDEHARRTEEIWEQWGNQVDQIELKRTQGFDLTRATSDASMALASLQEIENHYMEQVAFQQGMLGQVMQQLEDMEAETGDESLKRSRKRSRLISNIEGMRREVNDYQSVLSILEPMLQQDVQNPDWQERSANLSDAQSALANTPETNTIDVTNADGSITAQTVENPVYQNALAALESAKAELENTPKLILSQPYPNPDYVQFTESIDYLNQEISNLEAELNTILDHPTSADPVYTAVLAEKIALERLFFDLQDRRDAEIQAKLDIINAGAEGGAPDPDKLDAEIQLLTRNAEAVRDNLLAALDAEFTVTDVSTSTGDSEVRAQEIRDEIENHEKYIAELHNSKGQGRNAQEQMVQEIRGEIHGIEDQMEGMNNFMRELEDQQRPLHEKRMALDKERMVLEQKQRDIEGQRGPWEEERRRYEEDLWSGFDNWQHARQQEIEEQQEQMWELVRIDMDLKRKEVEESMKQMWIDFETEGRDAFENLDRELNERHKTEIEDMRRELDENRRNLQQAFEAEREEIIQEIEDMRDQLYEERMSPIEAEIDHLDEEIGAKYASIEGLYQQQEDLAGQLEDLEAQVRKLDQKAEFGLLSVIDGAINNTEKLEQNPASMAGAPGVSLADFLPAPPSRE